MTTRFINTIAKFIHCLINSLNCFNRYHKIWKHYDSYRLNNVFRNRGKNNFWTIKILNLTIPNLQILYNQLLNQISSENKRLSSSVTQTDMAKGTPRVTLACPSGLGPKSNLAILYVMRMLCVRTVHMRSLQEDGQGEKWRDGLFSYFKKNEVK